MKTKVIKEKDIVRKWHLIDARDQILGRFSTKIARILLGKNKPIYSPNLDCGDYVVVINAEKIKVTGKKGTEKEYFRHSTYRGGLHRETFNSLLAKNPAKVIELAVKGMLPKNRLGRKMIKKLKVYAGEKHPHTAQLTNPKTPSVKSKI